MIAEIVAAVAVTAAAAGAIVFGVRKWALDSREERRKEAEGLRAEMRAIEGRLRADAKEREERLAGAIGNLGKKMDDVCDRVTRVEAGLAELRDIVMRRGQGGAEPRAGA